jgi:hypothetical protein
VVRRKTFISYHHEDADEVREFSDEFSDVMIAKGIGSGVSDDDDFIDSDDTDYVLRRIREEYLADSIVTAVMISECTWARKYVDWEVAASLRNDPVNGRSGLLAILLPSQGTSGRLPDRVKDNVKLKGEEDGYGRFRSYPTSSHQLAGWLEDAVNARTQRAHLIASPRRDLKQRNSPC